MAGRPLEALALVGLGYRALSMAAQGVGPVKQVLRSMDSRDVATYVETLVDKGAANPRRGLRAFVRDHGITVS
jgi:phosphotransferase system enzyme I (PtsP)